MQDFPRFNHAMIHLEKGLLEWMTPASCKARNDCLDSMRKWHNVLIDHDPDRLIDIGEINNERFGNEIMRPRRRIMARMEAMNEETAASADLGLLRA